MKLTAIWENMIIKKISEATSTGIILGTDADAPTRWIVLDVGSMVDRKLWINIWDTIYFSKHATDGIDIDWEKLFVIKSFSILAKETK
jgi:co-chaperonin GroES (HSP10)